VLKDYADRIQIQLQRVKDVGKVELIGLQDEKIWIELSNLKLATLGVPLAGAAALQEQNAVSTAGFFETPSERLQLRVAGVSTVSSRSASSRSAWATALPHRRCRRGAAWLRPRRRHARFMGEDAIGLAVSMKDGGDILVLGKALEGEFERLAKNLPAGMELRKVSTSRRR
jgi:multidrug efflux pump